MADLNDLHPSNVPGRFFVDKSCIACDQCSSTAPAHFGMDDLRNSFIKRQPVSSQEIAICEAALGDCPVDAIGNSGLASATMPSILPTA
jgi:ferredoxin